jgi:Mrp family chromosome partitioning ATPase
LLRITAPRAFAAAPVARVMTPAAAEPVFTTPVAPAVTQTSPTPQQQVPVPPTFHPDLAASVTEIERVARDIRASGERGRKITLIGMGQNESVTLTALTLARLLARHAKVVLVELSISSPTVGAISNDPMAPGLSDLMLGSASFGQIISRDRLSQVHLIGAGRASKDRSLLQSPRLSQAIDALLRVYDHVVLDAGTAADLPATLLSANAQAVVIPDPAMNTQARSVMSAQLQATGFVGVTMLSGPADPTDADQRRPAAA